MIEMQQSLGSQWHPVIVLKCGSAVLAAVLFAVFQLCWRIRCLPQGFKGAEIILFKSK